VSIGEITDSGAPSERLTRGQSFLARASLELAKSLDVETTLSSIAQQAVPELGDWCVVHMLDEDGRLKRIEVAHADPEKVEWARSLQDRYPVDLDAPRGVGQVIRTREAELYPIIDPEMIKAAARDDQHLEYLLAADIRSVMIVPLLSRDKSLGTITFISSVPGRYDEADLELAKELAVRAALALENSRLYAAVSRELAEREKSEAELRESERRYRDLADSMPLMVWGQAPNRKMEFINRYFEDFTGMPYQGPEHAWANAIHPEDLAAARESFEAALPNGLPWVREARVRAADGTYRWHLSRLIPIRDGEQNIVRWIGTATDIHEQKLKEQAFSFLNSLSQATRPLAEPEEILQTTARMLAEYLGVDRCAYAEVDHQAFELVIVGEHSPTGLPSTLGRIPLQALGQAFIDNVFVGRTHIIEDVFAELPEQDRPAFDAQQIRASIGVPLLKDGKLVSGMSVQQTRPRKWTEEEIHLVELVVDQCWATLEQAKANRALHELNTTLEQRVQDRTAELQEAFRQLETFSYSVSHDLRSPLRAINMSASVLLEDYGDRLEADAREALRTIKETAVGMGALINDLLHFARLGQVELERRDLDLSRMAQEIADSLRQVHPEMDFRIRSGLRANADAKLTQALLSNLMENAVKYSRPDHPFVEVGAELGAFYVRDNGIGFDQVYAERVFAPFERLHRDDTFGGTGIGLANVKRIVERHGGRVWAVSESGVGSTFYFTLG
jgi:PAS domain S-box-containing protein